MAQKWHKTVFQPVFVYGHYTQAVEDAKILKTFADAIAIADNRNSDLSFFDDSRLAEIFMEQDIITALPSYKNAEVYGITIEGIKYLQKRPGMVKVGGDFVYPAEKLKNLPRRALCELL